MSAEVEKQVKALVAERIKALEAEWAVPASVVAAVEPQLRHVTKMLTGVCCLAGCLEGKQPRDDYLMQIPENLWVASILALRGHVNAANVAARQAIELLLKHLYFLDHPVEYRWVQTDDNLKEFGFQYLVDYVQRLPEFDRFEAKKQCVDTLSAVFAETSRYVHVHSAKFFSGGGVTKKTEDGIKSFKEVGGRLEKIVPCISSLVTVYQWNHYMTISPAEQKMIAISWSAPVKQAVLRWKRINDLART
ncbi:MAG: hypothetical protein QM715_00515 [Nibricoccus sp.]